MTTSRGHDDDHFHEECGVFAAFGHADAAAHTALGLHALQHRGQEAAGIVATDGRQFHPHRAMGLVGDIFSSEEVIGRLTGDMAIGHNRYSTTGETMLRNVQPLFADFDFGGLAIAHNGNLTNAYALRKSLVGRGCIFQSTMDTEIIVHLIARSEYSTVVDRLIDALRQVEGAYSLVAMTNDAIIGVRDPMGVRPLVLGRLDETHILSSETCALDIIGARFVRNVDPGEIIFIDGDGVRSIKPFTKRERRFCIFEYIYFARAGSRFRRTGGDRLRGRIGYPFRTRHHPQSLCGTHLHRAHRSNPPSRGQTEAQRQ
jgi:amidophosphoribosyltransferase